MKTILILEDNEERVADFTKAVAEFGDGYEVKFSRYHGIFADRVNGRLADYVDGRIP